MLTTLCRSVSCPQQQPLPPPSHLLHQDVQQSFSKDFIPYVITEIGCSVSPWLNLDVNTVQDYVNIIYMGYDYAIEHGDGFHSLVRPHTLIFYEALTLFKDQ